MDDDDESTELYLNYKTEFKATRIIDNVMYPTFFTLTSDVWFNMDHLDPQDRDYQLNLTLIKIDFFYKNLIDNSIMYGALNDWADGFLLKNNEIQADNVLVKCPLEPSDDHLAMLFQSKMNSLSKNNLVFGGVTITSNNSRGLSFTFVGDATESLPDMTEWIGDTTYFKEPWWIRDDSSTMDITPLPDADLNDKPSFAFDLDFLGESLKPENIEKFTNNVIKPKFRPYVVKNEDEDDT